MRRVSAVLVVVAVLGAMGWAVTSALDSGRDDAPDEAAGVPGEILVRGEDGDLRAYTAAEAAERIERLEGDLRRLRTRREVAVEDEAESAAGTEEPSSDGGLTPLLGPDGRPLPPEEIVRLALTSDDPATRLAAVRALRRVNGPEAGEALRKLLADPATPADIRLESARVLARSPLKDLLPEEMVALLAEERDPDVRAELAFGVARLRDRGAYMSEISALLAVETDPDVRRELFQAVARSSRDPAAKEELLRIASSPGADLDERRAALAALGRGQTDAATLARVLPLFGDADAEVRRNALRVLTASREFSIDTLAAALGDADPSVRAAALANGLRHLGRFQRDKTVDPVAVASAVADAVRLASSDPSADVRRSAVQNARSLPKDDREAVLAVGRADADPRVRLTAYAASGRDVARAATPEFVDALDSKDPWLRDYAYRQLERFHEIEVPYSSAWNEKARARAVADIRLALATSEYRDR